MQHNLIFIRGYELTFDLFLIPLFKNTNKQSILDRKTLFSVYLKRVFKGDNLDHNFKTFEPMSCKLSR
jgi:hypothetical protein